MSEHIGIMNGVGVAPPCLPRFDGATTGGQPRGDCPYFNCTTQDYTRYIIFSRIRAIGELTWETRDNKVTILPGTRSRTFAPLAIAFSQKICDKSAFFSSITTKTPRHKEEKREGASQCRKWVVGALSSLLDS